MIGERATLADVIEYFDRRIEESDRTLRDLAWMDAPVNSARERRNQHELIMLRDAVKHAAQQTA